MLGAPKDDRTVDWTTTALWIELVPIISILRIVTGRYGTYVRQLKVIQPLVTYVNIMWYKFIGTFITYNLSSKTIILIFIILVHFLTSLYIFFRLFLTPKKKKKKKKLKTVNGLCTFKPENLNVWNRTITYYLHITLHNFFCTVVNHTVWYIISYDTFIYIYIHQLILYEFNYNYDFHDLCLNNNEQ